jgi:hypothetical protein
MKLMSQQPARPQIEASTVEPAAMTRGAAATGSGTWLSNAGLWLIPASAVLLGLHWVYPSGPRTVEGAASTFGSPITVFIKEFLLFEGGLILLLFGVMVLGGYLARVGSPRWGQSGRILSMTAVAMFLPGAGIPTAALPGISDLYLSGHHEVGIVFDAFIAGHYGASFVVQFFVLLMVSVAGAVAMAVAGWRSSAVPRWCTIAFPIGFLLNVTDTPVIAWVGLALMLVTGVVIARDSKQKQGRALKPLA